MEAQQPDMERRVLPVVEGVAVVQQKVGDEPELRPEHCPQRRPQEPQPHRNYLKNNRLREHSEPAKKRHAQQARTG